jgi:transcriptional regulator with XRE-family HTH domain
VTVKVLKLKRLERDWSQRRLASESRIGRPRLSVIETGRTIPYEVELARLADALDFDGDPATLLDEVTISQ